MRSPLQPAMGALCAGLLLLGGCLGPAPSVPIQSYLLEPMPGEIPNRPLDAPIVAIVPVRMAAYLERDSIVARGEGNRVIVSQLHHWAEPLDAMLLRVMAVDLAMLMPDTRLVLFPWRGGPGIMSELRVQILRFDGALDGDVQLAAVVRVLSVGKPKLLLENLIQITEPTQGGGFPELVAAMNRALHRLSREIAEDVETLDLPRGSR